MDGEQTDKHMHLNKMKPPTSVKWCVVKGEEGAGLLTSDVAVNATLQLWRN